MLGRRRTPVHLDLSSKFDVPLQYSHLVPPGSEATASKIVCPPVCSLDRTASRWPLQNGQCGDDYAMVTHTQVLLVYTGLFFPIITIAGVIFKTYRFNYNSLATQREALKVLTSRHKTKQKKNNVTARWCYGAI